MKSIDFNSMVKGIFPIVISGVFLFFFPLLAHAVDVPSLSTQYCLTTSANPPEGGTVSPSGTNCYDSGQVVSITATPNPGYFFDVWFGDPSGTDNPTSITMNGNKEIIRIIFVIFLEALTLRLIHRMGSLPIVVVRAKQQLYNQMGR